MKCKNPFTHRPISSIILMLLTLSSILMFSSVTVPTDVLPRATVTINGKSILLQAYSIDGNDYFKLRDLAMAFNGTDKQFEISWDEEANAISIYSKTAYTPVGGELVTGNTATGEISVMSSSLYVNKRKFGLIAYNINGSNFFKLSDVMQVLDISMEWDSITQITALDTSKGYSTDYILFEYDGFTVIKTIADNIKPETIRSPICSKYIMEKGYYGINGGFFNTVFRQEPAYDAFNSVSIAWSREDAANGMEVCEVSKRDFEKIALGEPPYISRGTLFLYQSGSKYEAGVLSAESCDDVRAQMRQKTGEDYDYIYMIGGGNFYLSDYPAEEDGANWREEKYLEEGPLVYDWIPLGRTGIGIKKENDIWYVYLAVSGTNGNEEPKTLNELRNLFIHLECSDAVYLDGGNSSQMRCADINGDVIEKPGDNRYIWSMVRLIDVN